MFTLVFPSPPWPYDPSVTLIPLFAKYVNELIKIDFDGYAIGGLAVGETQKEMFSVLDDIKDLMPEDKPRYLMGVGTPSDILGADKSCLLYTSDAADE